MISTWFKAWIVKRVVRQVEEIGKQPKVNKLDNYLETIIDNKITSLKTSN
jgi:hypothetical protein